MKILNKKNSFVIKVIAGLIFYAAAGLIAYVLIMYAFIMLPFIIEDRAEEARIRKEITKTAGVKVVSVKVLERDDIIKIDIKNKGSVVFHYNKNGLYGVKPLIQIIEIGPYKTSFACEYIRSNQTLAVKTTVGLFFGKPSYFRKWFPFEVKNVQDLVTHYDTIINTVKMFPSSPTMSVIYDTNQWKKGKFVEELNPNFVAHVKSETSEVYCDMSIPNVPY